jgi:small subunit ribosomal protein S3e
VIHPADWLGDDLSDNRFSMKGYDPEGQLGPRKPLPDSVTIVEPPVDKVIGEPTSEQREPAIPSSQAAPVPEEAAFQQPQEAYEQTGFDQSGF